jgi:GNAT superfamily N-acetyltransferase
MELIITRSLTQNQFAQINQLWNDEYPKKLKDRFPILLDGVTNYNHYLIEDGNNNIIAWAVDFEKENEIRFSLIVSERNKGKGLGKLLVNKLKEEHEAFYGWVIDHDNDLKMDSTHYKSPINFYLKLGFVTMPECRIDNEMINAVKMKWQISK